MTLPRPIHPQTTYLLSRRCIQRQFLLRPSKTVNQVLLYCLGLAQKRTGVILHAFCAMSNHVHLVLTDPQGRLPEFKHLFDLLVAKCLNARRGRWGALWEPGATSDVRLETPDDVLGRMVYTLANPVAAGLVAQGHQWPGIRLGPEGWGQPVVVQRPYFFFRPAKEMPETVTVQLTRPAGSKHLSDEAFEALVKQQVEAREAEVRIEMARAGRGFLGRRAIREQSPTDSAQSWEPRRVRTARVACSDPDKRIAIVLGLKEFVRAYRAAWEKFKEGVRNVVFPSGTYAMRIYQGVICEAPV